MDDQMTERLLKVIEVSEILRVSPVQVYRLLARSLPAVRFEGSVRIRQSDLAQYIVDHVDKHDQEK
jgi:predicted DNA-binding transcriptional regulator AlpA